ncbi:RNA-binding S4 domain-containing protein [Paracrocinitomix mangrovi]|uniref:RNA-binding S4 domain-containing protein n=1 Tax=Paracrocinitomix mangrovi TaxID=2862509 RepID=UPI001C8F0A81|nr:S4 domain-containing protein [Paracrocinitomix mangrovi]UKN00660.1 RNA-binding S4 domain-containing protein [Paracrocinitomix mangrovi]
MARIDKYLWAVRLYKTRSLAATDVKNGKVMVNGEEVKAAKELKIGDHLSIKKNTAIFEYEVVDLLEKRVGAKLVEQYLRDITPEEEIEKYKQYQEAQRDYRQLGYGKPTKKDRRNIRKFLDD